MKQALGLLVVAAMLYLLSTATGDAVAGWVRGVALVCAFVGLVVVAGGLLRPERRE